MFKLLALLIVYFGAVSGAQAQEFFDTLIGRAKESAAKDYTKETPVGDTANRTTEALAQTVDDNVGGPLGDVLSGAISGTGDVAQVASDVAGQGVEILADGAGAVVQTGSDFVGWLTGR